MIQLLSGWDNFYVIIGSSAAALTGLQFVVIALVGESRRTRSTEALSAFGTPTIVHFCSVLIIAAFSTAPHQTALTLTLCLTATGAFGVVYMTFTTFQARRQRGYKPVLEDWIFHSILPFVAYAWVFVAGACLSWAAEPALYCVAGSALLLLFVGIHNAWDAAVWMTTATPRRRESRR